MSERIADIRDLSIRFDTQQGPVYPLRNVNIDVPRGQIVGIVGESGSGKSTLALALMRLLPGNAVVTGGEIELLGKDLLKLPAEEMRGLRGTRLAMIFQDPMTSLNPVRSIGQQMLDIQYRSKASRADKLAKAGSRAIHCPDVLMTLLGQMTIDKGFPRARRQGVRNRPRAMSDSPVARIKLKKTLIGFLQRAQRYPLGPDHRLSGNCFQFHIVPPPGTAVAEIAA